MFINCSFIYTRICQKKQLRLILVSLLENLRMSCYGMVVYCWFSVLKNRYISTLCRCHIFTLLIFYCLWKKKIRMAFYQMLCCNFAIRLAAVVKYAGTWYYNRVPRVELFVCSCLQWHMREGFNTTSGLFIVLFVCAGKERADLLDDSFLGLKK